VLHFNVTEHPTSAWTAQQIVDAVPWEHPLRYLLRDRDGVYAGDFTPRLTGLQLIEVVTAAGAPWQNAYVERLIGSIRRECLDHVIVRNARHLRRTLAEYLEYYHRTRTHLSLDKDAPEPRPTQVVVDGPIVALPVVGGLHHRYERCAA
jgi:putative transposase